MATEPKLAYNYCQRIAKDNARNFYYAFRTLPAAKRNAIYAVYAYCRICDDIADGDLSADGKLREFAQVRRSLLALHPSSYGAPIFDALHHAADAYQIPYAYFEQILQGVEIDITKSRFASFDDLREYCYKVASVVGLVCIKIFGYTDASAEKYAIDMGIAMQLTNILRDVKEDAERDRIYIPQDEMVCFGCTEAELMSGALTDSFRTLMAYQTARAQTYFKSSEPLFSLIDSDADACPRLMHTTYRRILNRIEQSGFNVFERRIGLSASEKFLLLAQLGLSSALTALRRASTRN